MVSDPGCRESRSDSSSRPATTGLGPGCDDAADVAARLDPALRLVAVSAKRITLATTRPRPAMTARRRPQGELASRSANMGVEETLAVSGASRMLRSRFALRGSRF